MTRLPTMEISVASGDLIEALSDRLSSMTIELETTRLALKQAQEGIVSLERELISARAEHVNQQMMTVPQTTIGNESHQVL